MRIFILILGVINKVKAEHSTLQVRCQKGGLGRVVRHLPKMLVED